jgi:NADPH-dependent glutamate synthase beta subunit-like oxidoreductase
MADDLYQVIAPSTKFYQDMVKCQAACPVNTDARGYVMAVACGDLERGYAIARQPNPLASMCGRICGAPCEAACRRGSLDEPVAIRPLKRTLTERFGPEAKQQLPVARREARLDPSEDLDASSAGWSRFRLEQLAKSSGRTTGKVALVGAGPASLAAAHDLAVLGHTVTIYEAGDYAGGMIRYGVPSYRIDWTTMDHEVQDIVDLGVEIRYNVTVGKDITLADLRRDHDAVFLGAGLMKGRDLRIEGHDLDGVIKAVDLLLNFNLGYKVDLGNKVIVVGGGDVAMDAARTALRSGQVAEEQREALASKGTIDEETEAVHDALDVARTALRLGAVEVELIALESWDELPASKAEIEEADEEGVAISPRTGPHRIVGKNGKVVGLETIEVESVFDAEGRFNPRFKAGSEKVRECDSVILAIGQAADLSLIGEAKDIEIGPRGFLVTTPETGATTAPDVFAGGDVAHGPRLLIHAVRDGHIAALSMDAKIQKQTIKKKVSAIWEERPNHQMPEHWVDYQRTRVPFTPVDRRTGVSQIELGFDLDEAAIQGMRCLECSVNTVFDGTKCILCNGCVDVCPWDCLKIVSANELTGNETTRKVLESHGAGGVGVAAMIKDDIVCTRCARCADRCPTGAVTMETFRFREVLAYES